MGELTRSLVNGSLELGSPFMGWGQLGCWTHHFCNFNSHELPQGASSRMVLDARPPRALPSSLRRPSAPPPLTPAPAGLTQQWTSVILLLSPTPPCMTALLSLVPVHRLMGASHTHSQTQGAHLAPAWPHASLVPWPLAWFRAGHTIQVRALRPIWGHLLQLWSQRGPASPAQLQRPAYPGGLPVTGQRQGRASAPPGPSPPKAGAVNLSQEATRSVLITLVGDEIL